MIILGADHAGFSIKEKIKNHFEKKKIHFLDVKPELEKGDDYPNVAFSVCKEVVNGNDRIGILICGSGTGMCIAANKIKGIRAVNAYDSFSAKIAKEHNMANVLCLRGRRVDFSDIIKIVKVFLKTKESKDKRHKRRVEKIRKIEG